MYREGYSVVRRRTDKSVKRTDARAAAGAVWTLHKNTCGWLRRSVTPVPAPMANYPGTVSCRFCKPLLDALDSEGAV